MAKMVGRQADGRAGGDGGVIIADANRDVLSALRLLLEQEGLRILGEASHGDQLVCLAHRVSPELVLLDWDLPGMAGEELLGRLRLACPEARLVVLSGRVEARCFALTAGADAFVSKAEPPEVLLRAVRSDSGAATALER